MCGVLGLFVILVVTMGGTSLSSVGNMWALSLKVYV